MHTHKVTSVKIILLPPPDSIHWFQGRGPECYGPNVCASENLYVEILTPNAMGFGSGAFGRLHHHEWH